MQAGTISELSFFSQLHPLTVLVYFVELFTLLLMFNHLILTIGLFGSVLGLCLFYFNRTKVRRLLVGSLSMMGLIVLFNLLLNQRGTHVLWQIRWGSWHFQLTESATIYGFTMAASLGAMILTFVLLNGVLVTPKLTFLLFPVVPRLAMLLTIALRLVDLLLQKLRRLVRFQKTRNLVVSEGTWRQRVKNLGRIFRVILVTAVSDAMETAVLMEARGFGAHKRSQYQRFQFQVTDGIFLGLSMIWFGVLIGLRGLGWGWTGDLTQLVWGTRQDVVLLIISSGLVLLPIIGEGGYRLWAN